MELGRRSGSGCAGGEPGSGTSGTAGFPGENREREWGAQPRISTAQNIFIYMEYSTWGQV